MKSIRTGMAGNLLRCSNSARLQVLILISTLAYLISIWCGLAVDVANQGRYYQVNTVSNRRVLSLFYLGLRVYRDPHLKLHKRYWKTALRIWQQQIQSSCWTTMPI